MLSVSVCKKLAPIASLSQFAIHANATKRRRGSRLRVDGASVVSLIVILCRDTESLVGPVDYDVSLFGFGIIETTKSSDAVFVIVANFFERSNDRAMKIFR